MMLNDMAFYLYWICFLHTTYIAKGQEMLTAPVNTAAERGSFARLNCTADLTLPGGGEDTLEWRHYLDGTTGVRIVISSNPDDITGEAYNLDYDVDRGRYDLIIDMSKDVGRNYNCHIYVADIRGEAQLVALDQFNCGTRNGVTKVIEGQSVLLDCGVSYKGYKKPNLEWASENGMQQGYYVEDEENPEIVFYVANVKAQSGHDKMEFSCSLAFEREDGEEEPPHYTNACTTSFEVEYGATDIEIYPNTDNSPDGIIEINVGQEMNCSASGNPEPTIYWYDNEGGLVSHDATLLILDDMITDEEPDEYKCVAFNIINMVEHKAEKTVPIRVFDAQVTDQPVTKGGLGTSEPEYEHSSNDDDIPPAQQYKSRPLPSLPGEDEYEEIPDSAFDNPYCHLSGHEPKHVYIGLGTNINSHTPDA